MRLYRIVTKFYGKDLNEAASLDHFVVADDDGGIYDRIERTYKHGDWPGSVQMKRTEIIAAKGDWDSEYQGEFYDQKYGWEDLGEVSEDDIAFLRRLKILA